MHPRKSTRYLCYFFFLVLTSPFITIPASGQGRAALAASEDTLAAILSRLNNAESDSAKYGLNDAFSRELYRALMLPGSGGYGFETIKTLVKAGPEDGTFRIYHWNLPSADGKKRYFGYLKVIKGEHPAVYPLSDQTDSIPVPDSASLDARHWFGALYYKVIACTTASGKPYYTLLGWSGNNAAVTQKVIEILSFDALGSPVFGLSVFPGYRDGRQKRVVFRYAASTSMSLKYEEQPVSTIKKWNAGKRTFDEKSNRAMMIVFDRLVPLDPQLEGQYQFYVTASDIYDCFIPVNGYWNFLPDVEAKNRH